jgi:hypothetical protein
MRTVVSSLPSGQFAQTGLDVLGGRAVRVFAVFWATSYVKSSPETSGGQKHLPAIRSALQAIHVIDRASRSRADIEGGTCWLLIVLLPTPRLARPL